MYRREGQGVMESNLQPAALSTSGSSSSLKSLSSLSSLGSLSIEVPNDEDMRRLGGNVARIVRGADVLALSGPLGAGKTTFAQGFGAELGIQEPVVSPTFTIARELNGHLPDGAPVHMVHVDAYRLGSADCAPGQAAVAQLLDELESLGLDEELEDPGENTVVLMEWGEQMAAALAPERLEIHIDRSLNVAANSEEPTSAGTRIVTLVPVGGDWPQRLQRVIGK